MPKQQSVTCCICILQLQCKSVLFYKFIHNGPTNPPINQSVHPSMNQSINQPSQSISLPTKNNRSTNPPIRCGDLTVVQHCGGAATISASLSACTPAACILLRAACLLYSRNGSGGLRPLVAQQTIELVSISLYRTKNQHECWVRWMSMSGKKKERFSVKKRSICAKSLFGEMLYLALEKSVFLSPPDFVVFARKGSKRDLANPLCRMKQGSG